MNQHRMQNCKESRIAKYYKKQGKLLEGFSKMERMSKLGYLAGAPTQPTTQPFSNSASSKPVCSHSLSFLSSFTADILLRINLSSAAVGTECQGISVCSRNPCFHAQVREQVAHPSPQEGKNPVWLSLPPRQQSLLHPSPSAALASSMVDGSTNTLNDVDNFERQLNNLFLQVKIKLEKGNKDDDVYLLKVNYEAMMEQIDGGFIGIEQAAIIDTLALGYMGAGDFKIVEHLLNLLKDIVGALHDDPPLLDSKLMHMKRMFTTLGKFEEAISLYSRGLKIIEREFGIHSPFLITPLMGMAKALGFTGRASEPMTLYYRAIDILEKRGTENEELVIPLSALDNLFIKVLHACTLQKFRVSGRFSIPLLPPLLFSAVAAVNLRKKQLSFVSKR
ncbi:hypothetical protein Cni_G19752 [Canna indica]|uniref:Uncharacterized protein n=1 Tax=Canna indica TaxID=4628 RepID=A0AAQ3KRY9_9LILI|nr:hypothetical protein Cni_G19752 [Canna indica]